MRLDVRICGDPVLREKASPCPKPFGKLATLVENMKETMEAEKGVGLAAPQVGRPIRLFIYETADEGIRVCVNPEITWRSETLVPYDEGCLSIPELNAEVMRPDRVTLKAWGLDGFRFTVEAEGLEARVIQHEYDHLDGILFVDRIGEKDRERVERALARLAARAASCGVAS